MKRDPIYEKAIRLIEGGQVSVDGHLVKIKIVELDENPCKECETNNVCLTFSDMHSICQKCDCITQRNCCMELVTNDKEIKQ